MSKLKASNRNRPSRDYQPLAPTPAKVAPLFRRLDWLTAGITFGVMWLVYFLTLAPELTLQDCGELVTGSYYAGIPHPPGYPVWTIYSWLWTVLLPVGNIAWRVAVGQATAGAIACGLLGLMVSRGSSLLMEGIEDLKCMTGQWESAICMVSGVVAGLLMGLDGFMWSESVVVNRISVFGVPWLALVLICLLRWIYAPHQFRYVYCAIFLFGICFTIHQSLIVAAIGIEITLAVAKPRLGRDLFFGNAVIYLVDLLVLAATNQHVFQNIGAKPGLLFLFNVVGLGSLIACGWLAYRTKGLLTEWKPVLIMALLWLLGVAFYFYLPIAGMTNPPMQWGYPRTVEGFFHALTRGQYEQPNPTNILAEPGRFFGQLVMLVQGVAEEFNWVYLLIGLVPLAFLFKMQPRERTWIIGLLAIYFCQGVLLMILLNPTPDRASADLVKVFFNSSHMVVACLVGYGLALIASFMATQYQRFRRWGLAGGAVAVVLAWFCLWEATGAHYFGPAGSVSLAELPHWIGQAFARDQYGLPIYGNLILALMPVVFLAALLVYRHRAPLAITLGLFGAMPLYSGLCHWADSEQRGHMFGYWFGHDMFTPPFKDPQGKPMYPEMTKDAVLFGGTDPGRFCPTYMIFCESFTPHHCQPIEDQQFDRRDVYIITQNALADPTYLNYIRAHYNRSAQIDPPFFQELLRPRREREENRHTNLLARMAFPLDWMFTRLGARVEKRRRTYTSWFKGEDFLDLPAMAARLRPGPQQDPVSKFIYENLSASTQQLLSGPGNEKRLRRSLAKDLNRRLERELSHREDRIPLFEPDRFKQVAMSEYLAAFLRENPQGDTRIRLNRLLLEAAYPREIAKSRGGVYPDREIRTPSLEDSQRCFQEYALEAQKRMQVGQLKPGEGVTVVDGRLQISGQVSVMAINGLLTKIIFDQNPHAEFFVEESMPLDWMYPYLTPFGIIMKVNRQPLPALTEEVLQKDHAFWKQYSQRLTGDFMDYNTTVKQVADWVEKTYLRGNFTGFTGDRKFIRDADAQKSFSKLRGALAGLYAWRLGGQCPPEYRPATNAAYQRLFTEANFAFLQAFAFCPYSMEVVYRYANLLLQFNRVDDAILVAETCLKLDPYNVAVKGIIDNLQGFKKQTAPVNRALSAPR